MSMIMWPKLSSTSILVWRNQGLSVGGIAGSSVWSSKWATSGRRCEWLDALSSESMHVPLDQQVQKDLRGPESQKWTSCQIFQKGKPKVILRWRDLPWSVRWRKKRLTGSKLVKWWVTHSLYGGKRLLKMNPLWHKSKTGGQPCSLNDR